MKTRLPISTVSYNTDSFLQYKLNELIKAKKISFWSYIIHKAEENEKKDHKHLFIVPSSTVQTVDLQSFFDEIDLSSDKPLKCMDFRPSKFYDWYKYCLHDIAYLFSKGEIRQFHYSKSDFVVSDLDNFDYYILESNVDKPSPYDLIKSALSNGLTWNEFVMYGCVPVQQIQHYKIAWQTLEPVFLSVDSVDSKNFIIDEV